MLYCSNTLFAVDSCNANLLNLIHLVHFNISSVGSMITSYHGAATILFIIVSILFLSQHSRVHCIVKKKSSNCSSLLD